MTWRAKAACRDQWGKDDDPFFAVTEREQRATIEVFCASCPVRLPCLEAAISSRTDHGVWGGMTESERRSYRRSRRRAG